MEEVQAMSEGVSHFATDQDSQLKNVWSTVEKFVSEDVQRDLPTGALNRTPLG